MKTIDSKLKTMRQAAARGELEVEHLIELAVIGDQTAVPTIRELQREYQWPRTNFIANARAVPLGRWAEVVCDYLDGGCEALVAYAKRPEDDAFHFAVSVLGEIKSPEAVQALVDLASDAPILLPERLNDRLSLSDAINLTLSFSSAPPVSPQDAICLRSFLHELLAECQTESECARVVCALRGVGDLGSFELIAKLPKFGKPWEGLEMSACKAIRKRLQKPPEES